jgi:hypothetical protein
VKGGVPGCRGPQLPANRPVAGVGFGHVIPSVPAADPGSHPHLPAVPGLAP